MKGLLLKDFMTFSKKIKPINRIILVVVIAILLITLKSVGAISISIMLPVFASSLPISLSISDEQWKWDRYAISMPITRRKIVESRYVFCLAILCLLTLIAFALNVGTYFIFHEFEFAFHIGIALAGFSIGVIYLLLVIPAGYILGINGSSAVMIIVFALVVGGSYLFRTFPLQIKLPATLNFGVICVGIVLAGIVLAIISVAISVKAYSKKHS